VRAAADVPADARLTVRFAADQLLVRVDTAIPENTGLPENKRLPGEQVLPGDKGIHDDD